MLYVTVRAIQISYMYDYVGLSLNKLADDMKIMSHSKAPS